MDFRRGITLCFFHSFTHALGHSLDIFGMTFRNLFNIGLRLLEGVLDYFLHSVKAFRAILQVFHNSVQTVLNRGKGVFGLLPHLSECLKTGLKIFYLMLLLLKNET